MRCPSCAGLIEESDVQFCPFCGMQIRVSSAGKPIQRTSGHRHTTSHSIIQSFIFWGDGIVCAGWLRNIRTADQHGSHRQSGVRHSWLVYGAGHLFDHRHCSKTPRAREIAASNGRLGGSGRARAGITMGYIQLALSAFLCILAFVTLLVVGMAGPG